MGAILINIWTYSSWSKTGTQVFESSDGVRSENFGTSFRSVPFSQSGTKFRSRSKICNWNSFRSSSVPVPITGIFVPISFPPLEFVPKSFTPLEVAYSMQHQLQCFFDHFHTTNLLLKFDHCIATFSQCTIYTDTINEPPFCNATTYIY